MSEHAKTLEQVRDKIVARRRDLANVLAHGAGFDLDQVEEFLDLDAFLSAVKRAIEDEPKEIDASSMMTA